MESGASPDALRRRRITRAWACLACCFLAGSASAQTKPKPPASPVAPDPTLARIAALEAELERQRAELAAQRAALDEQRALLEEQRTAASAKVSEDSQLAELLASAREEEQPQVSEPL